MRYKRYQILHAKSICQKAQTEVLAQTQNKNFDFQLRPSMYIPGIHVLNYCLYARMWVYDSHTSSYVSFTSNWWFNANKLLICLQFEEKITDVENYYFWDEKWWKLYCWCRFYSHYWPVQKTYCGTHFFQQLWARGIRWYRNRLLKTEEGGQKQETTPCTWPLIVKKK